MRGIDYLGLRTLPFAFRADAAVVIVRRSGVRSLLVFVPDERVVDVKEMLVKGHGVLVLGRTAVQLRDEQPVRHEMTDVIAVQNAHGSVTAISANQDTTLI